MCYIVKYSKQGLKVLSVSVEDKEKYVLKLGMDIHVGVY